MVTELDPVAMRVPSVAVDCIEVGSGAPAAMAAKLSAATATVVTQPNSDLLRMLRKNRGADDVSRNES